MLLTRAHSLPLRILPNSVATGQFNKFRGEIVQIPRLATTSHFITEKPRAVQKLELLTADIVLKADTH